MSLVSEQCINFVKQFEGFCADVEPDCVGVPTLGYGMTGQEIAGLSHVTEEQATQLLRNHINNEYAAPLKNDLDSRGVHLNQNQFDALVSMAYNVGVDSVLGSTLYRNVCQGVRDVNTITQDFCMWDKAGGRTLEGLLRRRKSEAAMFFGSGNIQSNVSNQSVSDSSIANLQRELNSLINANLVVDGLTGPATNAAVKEFQSLMGLAADGIAGINTWSAINQIRSYPTDGITYPHYEYATRWIQWRIGTTIDGVFGSGTAQRVKDFQQSIDDTHGENLSVDGIVGKETWRCMFKY